ncbi:DNRLRE domain-containing protein [Nonomuraea sp. NPDC050556]|uniref:DNRLRE domain-containing protein n=1 Tax=Nonomuraea sp. NPDC050556 TaxID=3364369 RepID=UPI00379C754C
MAFPLKSSLAALSLLAGALVTVGQAAAPAYADPETQAFDTARRTGTPVELTGRATETTQVFAEPGGSVTVQEYMRPVRAKRDGAWVPVDPTLKANADGTISPAVSTFPMTFSGGGAGPMATMVKGGRSLSMTFPGVLPKPALEANTATYTEVLPGVDLKIVAAPDGFVHHLVVKSREAAANPLLRTLKFGLRGGGLKVARAADGGLSATAPEGEEVFAAPVPVMWDATARKVRDATMAAKVAKNTLEIVPDRALLDDPATVYPVTIDPSWHTGWKSHWAIAAKRAGYSSVAGTAFYDSNRRLSSDWPPVASVGYESDTGVTARSFFAMNMDGLQGAQILSARFRVYNQYSWSNSPRNVDLLWTSGIDANTTWNNQPWSQQVIATKSFAYGYTTPGQNVEFDVTGPAQTTAGANAPILTLGLKAQNENDAYGWKKFGAEMWGHPQWQDLIPALIINYNRPPKLAAKTGYKGPWNNNASDRPLACDPNNVTWQYVPNTDLTLTATGTDPDGDNLLATFAIWESGHDSTPIHVESRWIANGGTASITVPAWKLTDGVGYWWWAKVSDQVAEDTSTNSCPVMIDKTAPTKPVITSTDGVALTKATTEARQTRRLRFTSTDTNLTGFCYALNGSLSLTGGGCGATGTWVPASNGAAEVDVMLWGSPRTRLDVAALDASGNVSPYDGSSQTLVAARPPTFVGDPETGGPLVRTSYGDRYGDLTGDGVPDLVTANNSGVYRIYRGRQNERPFDELDYLDPQPNLAGLLGARFAHRGDFAGYNGNTNADGYEDVFVLRTDGTLTLYPNEGGGRLVDYAAVPLKHPGGGTWSQATQIVAPGDLDGDLDADLLVVEGGRLLLFAGTPTGPLALGANGELAAPKELMSGLGNVDVVVPGGTRDLLLRDRDTGAVLRATGSVVGGYTTAPYSGEAWPAAGFPLLAAPGDMQGKVVATADGPIYQPQPGKEGADLLVTARTAEHPAGLYLYPATDAGRQAPVTTGSSGWTGWIAGIF